jgi:hypothetical protein
MPILWPQTPSPASQPTQVDQDLVITSRSRTIDPNRQILIVEGDVTATYAGEVITADKIEIHFAPDQRRGIASGHVQLTDPDGKVTATQIEFSWKPSNRYAKADGVVAVVAGSTISAKSLELTQKLWTFTDFAFTNDRARVPIYKVSGKTMTIVPKKSARVVRPTVSIFGHKIVTWPVQRYTLDPAATGIHPPIPTYHDGGLGVSWHAGQLVAPETTAEVHFDTFRGELPGSGIQLTHSFLPDSLATRPIAPRTELYQRFDYGYFENLQVGSPQAELDLLSSPRNAITILNNNNSAAIGRGVPGEEFTFPVEAGYENGGPIGSFGYFTDLRVESIRKVGDEKNLTRSEAEGSLEFPSYTVNQNTQFISRADAEIFRSNQSFGWGRLSGGLAYTPSKGLSLGVGLAGAFQSGKPDYDIDPLAYTNGAMARADYNLGPHEFGVLFHYDVRRGLFDKEFLLGQVMGPFQAYVLYRQYPGDTHFGFTLRLDPLFDALRRRRLPTP